MLPAFHGCCGLPSCTVRSDETDLGPRCLHAHQRIYLVHARASADACSLAAAAAAAAIAAMVTTYVCPWWQGPSLQQAASRFFRPPPSRCADTRALSHFYAHFSAHPPSSLHMATPMKICVWTWCVSMGACMYVDTRATTHKSLFAFLGACLPTRLHAVLWP